LNKEALDSELLVMTACSLVDDSISEKHDASIVSVEDYSRNACSGWFWNSLVVRGCDLESKIIFKLQKWVGHATA
jgi:hypothetical protein